MATTKPKYKIMKNHPELIPYEGDIKLRVDLYRKKKRQILGRKFKTVSDFANAHEYFGFHLVDHKWIYREWAPAADAVYLTGDFNNWDRTATPLTRVGKENWEVVLPEETLTEGCNVMTVVQNGETLTQHIPLFARYVTQDTKTLAWTCRIVNPADFDWTDADFSLNEPVLIYEAHVGMASEEGRVASYREFADNVLPRVKKAGYNTVQLMGIMEHPYYGSFGYQVSNFYAASSRYGKPEDLKYLINTAHQMGIRVLLDVVHSHAVKNTVEGINMFDGTVYQFFHEGGKGEHPAWGTKLFDYAKPGVLHFLLSNLKFWLKEYHFDGFRFDGVTSMLYHNHGLGDNFSMDKYFTMNTDTEAITYLQLASELIHQVNPNAICIAEDMSGMPGMCEPIEDGGIGFDFRLAMGLPDMWTRLIKEQKDEDWNMDRIWTELVFRNAPTVGYVECHDQALQGSQTVMFRLAGDAMYTQMEKRVHTDVIDRAIALHKMIRLLTLSAGGEAYLNFMGNEFGHPEWIDFPREGNGWSYHYCRRQWSLADNQLLKYSWLNQFDRDMLTIVKENNVLTDRWPTQRLIHCDDHILAFERGGLLFVFNFHPGKSFTDYVIPVGQAKDYSVIMSSDDSCYGGYGQVDHNPHSACIPGREGNLLRLYIPCRTAMILKAL